MSFDWTKYHALAVEIYRNRQQSVDLEASCRTAISRAYYSVYMSTSGFLESLRSPHQSVSSESEHQKIYIYLRGLTDPDRRGLGNRLMNLHKYRKAADYKSDLSFLRLGSVEKIAETSLSIAQAALGLLNKIQS